MSIEEELHAVEKAAAERLQRIIAAYPDSVGEADRQRFLTTSTQFRDSLLARRTTYRPEIQARLDQDLLAAYSQELDRLLDGINESLENCSEFTAAEPLRTSASSDQAPESTSGEAAISPTHSVTLASSVAARSDEAPVVGLAVRGMRALLRRGKRGAALTSADAEVKVDVVLDQPEDDLVGWHPDPYDSQQLRLFDGTRWTDLVLQGDTLLRQPIPG